MEYDLLLYVDDSCLVFTGKDLTSIENELNKDADSLFSSLMDNMLSIHSVEDKTKSILLGNKRQIKNAHQLNIKHGEFNIEQHLPVTYLGCCIDDNMTGDSMVIKVMNKINGY